MKTVRNPPRLQAGASRNGIILCETGAQNQSLYGLSGFQAVVSTLGRITPISENDEAPGELFPESELRFFSKTADDVVAFDLDSQGRVARMVIHTGGRSIPVDRVDIINVAVGLLVAAALRPARRGECKERGVGSRDSLFTTRGSVRNKGD